MNKPWVKIGICCDCVFLLLSDFIFLKKQQHTHILGFRIWWENCQEIDRFCLFKKNEI